MVTTLFAMIAMFPIDLPRIDGDAFKPWGSAGLPIVALAGRGPQLRSFNEFGAVARLGWNAEGLLAEVEVTDATPTAPADLERPYEGDSVELYLGLPGTPPQMVQLVTSAAGKKFFDYRAPDLRDRAPLEGRSSFERSAHGYVVRALIGWKSLGIEPKAGLVVGARVAVNDAAPGRDREGLIWQGGDFFDLPSVRLAETGGKAPSTAVWAAAKEDLTGDVVHLVAEPGLAGKKVRFGERSAILAKDGPRAVASFDLPVAPGSKTEGSALQIEGEPDQAVTLPDLDQLRRQAFMRGTGVFRPSFGKEVFDGLEFPAFHLRDQGLAERIVGPISVEKRFYGADGRLVEHATQPGRYGAIVTVKAEHGGETTIYRTLFRGKGEDAVLAAAALEGKSDAEKADRDWWHALRKRLGTAVHYETFMKFPDGDPAKKWPLIVYLHGSGGGDEGSWEKVKVADGPMGPAHARKDFPFAVLSLRSFGGWYPPAVKDAIDEAVKTGRIDENQIILTGFSMGGMGTWNVAYDEPGRFAAIVPVGGRRGDAARMALIKGTPVWVFNGERDEATYATDARAAVQSLKDVGGNVRYTEIPKASHVDSLRFAYAMPELYEWMLKQRKI